MLVYILFAIVIYEDHVKNPLGCNNVKKKFENQLISHLKFDDMQDTWLNIEQVNCSEYCFGIMDSVTRSYLFFLVWNGKKILLTSFVTQVGKSACIVLAKERHSKGERGPEHLLYCY